MFSIYSLNDPINNIPRYIGFSSDVEKRYCQHLRYAKNDRTHKGRWIQSLIYNQTKPSLSVIETCLTKEQAIQLEKYFIKKYREDGYPLTNGTDGGEGGATMLGKMFSDDHRSNISKALKGKPSSMKGITRSLDSNRKQSEAMKGRPSPRRGAILSEETKQKIREANIGKVLSKETKNKISITSKGREPNIGMTGQHHSLQTRNKIAVGNRGQIRSNETRTNISNSIKIWNLKRRNGGINNG